MTFIVKTSASVKHAEQLHPDSSGATIVNPLEYKGWNEEIVALPGASTFHSSDWMRVLSECYGFKARAAVLRESERLTAVWPFMEIDSRWTGRRGVSLPFSDDCPPLGDDKHMALLLNNLKDYGRSRNWKSLQLRGPLPDHSNPAHKWFYTHSMKLRPDPATVWTGLKPSVRRIVRQAEKNELVVRVATSMDAMEAYYRLHELTRRRQGVPPQSLSFFRAIQRHLLDSGDGFIVTAFQKKIPVASAVFLHFNNQLIYKFGASNQAGRELRANNLVMWKAISHGCTLGLDTLCFGRTDPDQEGLRRFKKGWGAREDKLDYYCYGFKEESFMPGEYSTSIPCRGILRRTPLALNRVAGRILYPHAA
jgi:hypothetical protein